MQRSPAPCSSIRTLRRSYDLQRRNVKYGAKQTEIELFNLTTGLWESVIETKGVCRIALAEFIAFEIELYHQLLDQIEEAMTAFTLCLECNDLSWEAEQSSDLILRKLEQSLLRANRTPRKRRKARSATG